jgi:hypothetical protein
VSLAARHLEANGIPTVVIGSARDIVEQCGVARMLFTDFPLGNPCGQPYDAAMQRSAVEMAFRLFETAVYPRTTVQTPFCWPDDEWRRRFMEVDEAKQAEFQAMGEARRAQQSERKAREAAARA